MRIVMPTINGKRWRCPARLSNGSVCGCIALTQLSPTEYGCNKCRTLYDGVRDVETQREYNRMLRP